MSTPVSLLSPDELNRLRALRQLDVLPALQEPVFDAFVRLTALLFDLPISLIAIVEEQEAYYKANQGLPGFTRQPREEAICALTVREGKAVVLVDVAQESNRLTQEAASAAQAKNLQFYAGVPLPMPSQHFLGTICVIDHRPRTFSDAEEQLLHNIAELIAHTLVIRHCGRSQEPYGDQRWQLVQQQLTREVTSISQLVAQLNAQFGPPVLASPLAAKVTARLNGLGMILIEYHQSLCG
jgi:putative methionine-R-sulfoxide reductase with GAF domain